jgi:predicted rRNA methylase YqxC with S4 and FtsJ domains
MSNEQTLVDYLVDTSKTPLDTSMARRLIVEGRVKLNGEVVTDPAFRLPFDDGFILQVDKGS